MTTKKQKPKTTSQRVHWLWIPVVGVLVVIMLIANAPRLPTGADSLQAAPVNHISRPPLPATVPLALNGVPVSSILFMPDLVIQQSRAIYAVGQQLGRDPRRFTKIGDSTIEPPFFLADFDQPGIYNLADYAGLQPAIDWFAGSFARTSVAVQRGLHTWAVLDPSWADDATCQPNETLLACEYRLTNPSIVFIRLGANDTYSPEMFAQNLRKIIELSMANGVIPVVGTRANADPADANNHVARALAGEYHVPLMDFDLVARTLPENGLRPDGVHMTMYPDNYADPLAFTYGYPIHDLTALMMLEALRAGVMG